MWARIPRGDLATESLGEEIHQQAQRQGLMLAREIDRVDAQYFRFLVRQQLDISAVRANRKAGHGGQESAMTCRSSIRHSRHSIGGFTLKPA
jgi:hypothetical protein